MVLATAVRASSASGDLRACHVHAVWYANPNVLHSTENRVVWGVLVRPLSQTPNISP